MKKIGLSSVIAGLLIANVVVAGPVAVKGGAVFLAGNNEFTVDSVDGGVLPASCGLDSKVGVFSLPFTGATDVVISDGKAFVTGINEAGRVLVTIVDVDSCLVHTNSCDAEPTVDLDAGVLLIPCLEANGKRYDITMNQRGNSMNWEVTGIDDSRHHHSDD